MIYPKYFKKGDAMKWMDLSAFGAELKKIELDNGSSFPALVITDIAKYKQSGAVALDVIKSKDNPTSFSALPGGRVGRAFNSPILLMSPTAMKDGAPIFKLREGLVNLLNISESAVEQLTKEMPDEQVILKNGFMDLAQFEQLKQASAQKFYGTTLYVLKTKEDPMSLYRYKEKISREQHGMFPVGNIANIPFESLAKFGLNSSIFERAFINEADALKAGYSYNDLKPVRLIADVSILPVSMNADNSVNVITDMNAIPQLAYSNFEWKKNLNIIQDYNTLLVNRELTRDILNARLLNVINVQEMEAHLTKMSITLQNINVLNNVSKTYKAIKFNNKGVAHLLMKNQKGEWRHIEKNGPTRIDRPLTKENYLTIISTIGNANHVIADALALKLMSETERSMNMVKVENRHLLLHKQFIKPITDPKFNNEMHIGLNPSGSRIAKTFLDSEINKFERNVGGDLYSRQVEDLLANIAEMDDSNDLANIVGAKFNDEQTLANSLKVVKPVAVENTVNSVDSTDDLLAVAGFFDGSLKTTIDEVGVTRVQLGELHASAEKSVLLKDFTILPKGISPTIDANYHEAQNIYSALQHISLSVTPWLNQEVENLLKQKEHLFTEMTMQHISVFSGIEKAITRDDLNKVEKLIKEVEAKIEVEKIKENILTYQFSRLIPDSSKFIGGFSAFDSDANGNFVPFSSDTAYYLTTASLKNTFEKNNTSTNGPKELENPVLVRLEDYVESQYKRIAMPIGSIASEIAKVADSIMSINYSFTDVKFDNTASIPLPLDNNDLVSEYLEVYEGIAKAVSKYQDYDSSSDFENNPLDTSLIVIARRAENYRNTLFLAGTHTSSSYASAILRQYEKFEFGPDETTPDDRFRFVNPGTLLSLTDMEKLEVLKEIYTVSLSELTKLGESSVLEQHLKSGQDFAASYTKANEYIADLDGDFFHKDLAGKFLVSHQSGNINDKGLPSAESSYAYALTSDQPYKVMNISSDGILPEGQVRLNSSSFNEALKDTFAVFQLHSVASVYGITPVEVMRMSAYVSAIRQDNLEIALKYSSDIFKLELSPTDLKTLSFEKSTVLDSNGNRPIIIKTPTYGSMDFEPASANLMIAKVALLNQLSGQKSNFEVDPIIKGIGNLNHFVTVHKYLAPDAVESQILAEVQNSNDYSVESYSKEAAETAFQKALSRQAVEAGVAFAGNQIHIVMNQPETTKDLAIARIVPAEWNVPISQNDRIRSFDVVSIQNQAECKEILTGVVGSLMDNGVNGLPITPKFLHAIDGVPDVESPLTKFQDAVLNQGQALFVTSRSSNDPYLDFFSKYATAALVDAFANMPNIVREHTNQQLAGEIKNSLPVNFFVEETSGISLPRIRFLPENAEFPVGYKLADQVSTGLIIRMVDPREERTPAFKLEEYNGENLSSNDSKGAIRAFSATMKSAGFNVANYEAAVIAQTVDQEKSAVFHQVFGDEYLKNEDVVELYGQHLYAQLLDIQKSHPNEMTAHVRFSNELTKPYLIVGPGETSDPLAIKIPVHSSFELCKSKMHFFQAAIGQRTPIEIVNNIKPIKMNQGELTDASLALIAANFREQAKVLSGTNFVDAKLDDALKTSTIWVKNDGVNLQITMAASKVKSELLINDGMVALVENHHGFNTHKSPLNVLYNSILNLKTDSYDQTNLASRLNSIAPNSTKSENSLNMTIGDFIKLQLSSNKDVAPERETPVAIPKDASKLKTIGEIVKQQLNEANALNNTVNVTDTFINGNKSALDSVSDVLESTQEDAIEVPKTKFSEVFNGFPVSDLNNLSGTKLRAKLSTMTLWPVATVADHAESAHQNLDTYVFSRLIRENLPMSPELNSDNANVLQVAKNHYFELKEIYGAVSASKTTDDLLRNFRDAHRKIIKVDPDYLDRTNGVMAVKRKELTMALLKASALRESGLSVVDAFKEASRDVPYFKTIYSQSVINMAHSEKLLGNEKSFVHALNGFVLDIDRENGNETNPVLFNRFKETPVPSSLDHSSFTAGNLTGVTKDILVQIDSINKADFKHSIFTGDLKNKWGVDFKVENSEMQFSQGYGNVIDKTFAEIHESLGGFMPQDQLGLGFTIIAGRRLTTNHNEAINLLGVDDLATTKMKEAWIHKVLDQSFENELNQMNVHEKSLLSGVQEKGQGFIDMACDHGYEPKTDGLKALVAIHHQLKEGFPGVEKQPKSESILSQVRINFTEKFADFRNEIDQSEDGYPEKFAKYFYHEMEKKQNLIFETIESRMVKSIPASIESGDLYPLKSVESNLQKVFNIDVSSGKPFIGKFIDLENSGKDKLEIESIAFELHGSIQDSLAMQLAISALESRASLTMMQLLDKHVPDIQKNDTEFAKQIQLHFPLIAEYIPDTSKIDDYESALARKFIDFSSRNDMAFKHDDFHDSQALSKDQMVFHFVGLAVNNEDYAGLTLSDSEIPHASRLVGEFVSKVANEGMALSQKLENDLTKRADLGPSLDM